MLMASLPYLGHLFGEKRTPISRLRLEARLSMLTEADLALLRQIEDLAQWDYLSRDQSDEEIVAYAQSFIPTISHLRLREIITARLELRTLVAALRLRQRGAPPPGQGQQQTWGYGRWVRTLERNWNDPLFGLGTVFPWLKEASQLLHEKDGLALERLLLGLSWRELNCHGAGHDFDFVAVVIYVLKWDILARWARYDGEIAAARFRKLVADGLHNHRHLFADSKV